jgi:hypothetical protein
MMPVECAGRKDEETRNQSQALSKAVALRAMQPGVSKLRFAVQNCSAEVTARVARHVLRISRA